METVRLWNKAPFFGDEEPDPKTEPSVDTYFIRNSPACVLICPGGGYEFLSLESEGRLIAEWFNERGISAAVLRYRVAPYTQPHPQLDVKRAMRFLRKTAEETGYPKDRIGVMGFSAGGHLAGCAAVHYEAEENPSDEIDRYSSRPDFQILCYAVISTDMSFSHQGSVICLLGKELENEELAEYYALETQVTKDTPPAFIFHTAEDDAVPVKNSIVYAHSLAINGVPTELHIYPDGRHGVSLAKDVFHTSKWTEDLERWLFETIIPSDN